MKSSLLFAVIFSSLSYSSPCLSESNHKTLSKTSAPPTKGWMVGANLAPTMLVGTHYGIHSGYRFSKSLSLEWSYRAMGRSIGPKGGIGSEFFRTTDLSIRWGILDFLALKTGIGSTRKETNNYLVESSSNDIYRSRFGSSKSTLLIANLAISTSLIELPTKTSSFSVIAGIDYLFIDKPVKSLDISGTDRDYEDQARTRHSKVEFGWANLHCGVLF